MAAVFALALAVLLASCSLDFNDAIPCEGNDHCAPGFVCNLSIGRCELGLAPVDDTGDDPGADTTDTADPDVTTDPDVADDPELADDPDLVDDSAGDPTAEPDLTGDACVPQQEVCNGEDDDCDGEIDNGLDCGSCPDEGMALIVRGGMTSFCVDLYEASREDATQGGPGTNEDNGAFSQNRVIPWFGAGLEQARTACATVGKRLCTTAEWTEACGGPAAFLYP
jgi:hypothetical protein